MNKEEPYRDQAERLKKRIEKINGETDAGNLLPPREQIHRQKRKKTKVKIKYPVIRLLVLFFILLPIIYLSVISYLDGKKISGTEKTSGNSVGYETINLEKHRDDESQPIKQEKQKETKKETSQTANFKETSSSNETADKKDEAVGPQLPDQTTNTNQTVSGKKSNTEQTGQTNPAQKEITDSTKIIYHTVSSQETLYRIAIKYFNSKDGIDIIKKANNLVSDEISAGQVLKIPLKN